MGCCRVEPSQLRELTFITGERDRRWRDALPSQAAMCSALHRPPPRITRIAVIRPYYAVLPPV